MKQVFYSADGQVLGPVPIDILYLLVGLYPDRQFFYFHPEIPKWTRFEAQSPELLPHRRSSTVSQFIHFEEQYEQRKKTQEEFLAADGINSSVLPVPDMPKPRDTFEDFYRILGINPNVSDKELEEKLQRYVRVISTIDHIPYIKNLQLRLRRLHIAFCQQNWVVHPLNRSIYDGRREAYLHGEQYEQALLIVGTRVAFGIFQLKEILPSANSIPHSSIESLCRKLKECSFLAEYEVLNTLLNLSVIPKSEVQSLFSQIITGQMHGVPCQTLEDVGKVLSEKWSASLHYLEHNIIALWYRYWTSTHALPLNEEILALLENRPHSQDLRIRLERLIQLFYPNVRKPQIYISQVEFTFEKQAKGEERILKFDFEIRNTSRGCLHGKIIPPPFLNETSIPFTITDNTAIFEYELSVDSLISGKYEDNFTIVDQENNIVHTIPVTFSVGYPKIIKRMISYTIWFGCLLAIFILLYRNNPHKATVSGSPSEPQLTVLFIKNNVNVRINPSTSAKIIARVKQGTRLAVIDSTNSWYKITFQIKGKDEVGWVHRSLVVPSSKQ